MENARQQLVEKLQTANHVLVTVSRNPSVDQLAACIGLTLIVNKLDKHGTAVFSGEVPSTLEFLQPEDTLEKNTDSLRDFIIALDKSKADKLRYKVEDDVVRIFITPYKTSISQDDLQFTQGDFNVDLVFAVGVKQQDDLDEAILSHGRILHDATVCSINLAGDSNLGSINWNAPEASSLSELVAQLAGSLGENLLDSQIATALLTGIVAETDRFSNEKTSAQTMSVSAALMAAGANQQLVASKLQVAAESSTASGDVANNTPSIPLTKPKSDDGTLEIVHADAPTTPPEPTPSETTTNEIPEIPPEETTTPHESHIDPDSIPSPQIELPAPAMTSSGSTPEPAAEVDEFSVPRNDGYVSNSPRLVISPLKPDETSSGTVPAATSKELTDMIIATPITDAQPASTIPTEPFVLPGLTFASPSTTPAASVIAPASAPVSVEPAIIPEPAVAPSLPPQPTPEPFIAGLTPPPPAWVPPNEDPFNLNPPVVPTAGETLADLEVAVHSPHVNGEGLDAARDEVMRALTDSADTPQPIQALNAQPLGDALHTQDVVVDTPPASPAFTDALQQAIPVIAPPTDALAQPAPVAPVVSAPQVIDPNAPPPVPPPIPFNFGASPQA